MLLMIFWSSWITNSLKPSKLKLSNIKISFRVPIKETPLMRTLFIPSVSAHYNKRMLSARFGNHIMETDKTIYKVGRKNTNEFFFKSSFADSSKKRTMVYLK